MKQTSAHGYSRDKRNDCVQVVIALIVTPDGFPRLHARSRQVRQREGRYLLRTNLIGKDPAELWRFYIQLVEIEAAFRTMKDDLQLRPSHRGAHLRRLPGLLPARHAARPAQAAGPRPRSQGRAR
jgi:hypothetical protein